MLRIRFMFLFLALFLALPLGLLVHRSLESMASERALRHRNLAERIFDETERELTVFLRREEEIPFEHFRYFYVQRHGGSEELVRSPLADLPAEDFIIGYFQVEPNGVVSTPLVDVNLLPAPVDGWSPSVERYEAVQLLQALVGDLWRDEIAPSTEPGTVPKQAPGTTRVVAEGPSRRNQTTLADGDIPLDYQYLGSLNNAAESRLNRQSQVALSLSTNVFTPADPAGGEPSSIAPSSRKRPAARALSDEPVVLSLGTMEGRRLSEKYFLLHRSVDVGDVSYRQGLVVELDGLIAWLGQRVLEERGMVTRGRLFLADDDDDFATAQSFRYRHQYAPPFSEAASILVLAPLPETLGESYVILLSGLVVVSATIGLYGLYRMVGATVSFAERRQRFVDTVTHELRTPLTAIRMRAEMLRDGAVPGNDKRQEYYGVMTAESERLTRLVDNILELAKIERKARVASREAAPLRPTLEQVVQALEPYARGEGFSLVLDIEPDLPPVSHDPDGLSRVLFNLIDNAIKYGRGDAREIQVKAHQNQGRVEIAVVDRGPGVDATMVDRILEPFYRGPRAKSVPQGAGMGLALVVRLVEAMGGTVQCENLEGGGFAVRVALLPRFDPTG